MISPVHTKNKSNDVAVRTDGGKPLSLPTSPITCNYLTLGNHRTQEMTNLAKINILFCE